MIAETVPVPRARLSAVQHFALYTAFHRSPRNRLAHAVLVPVVLFSAMCLEAYVRIPGAGPFAHLGTLLSIVVVLALASIDRLGAALLGVALALGSYLAGEIATASPWLVAPLASLVHAAAWYGTVVIGHERLEAPIETEAGAEDTNLYFRRAYFRGAALGRPVGRLDAMVQFCIAPLAVVQDALTAVGLRAALEDEIASERQRIHGRLRRGLAPFDGAP